MSVLIPATTKAWLDLIPWVYQPAGDNFFQAVSEAIDGDRIIPGLSLYPMNDGRYLHELAHLIQCEDKHVLCPYWGYREFIFIRGLDKLSVEAGLVELEVFCIEAILRWFLNLQDKPGFYFASTLATNMVEVMKFSQFMTVYDLEQIAQAHVVGWTIDTCWLEFIRKAQLIRSITGG